MIMIMAMANGVIGLQQMAKDTRTKHAHDKFKCRSLSAVISRVITAQCTESLVDDRFFSIRYVSTCVRCMEIERLKSNRFSVHNLHIRFLCI